MNYNSKVFFLSLLIASCVSKTEKTLVYTQVVNTHAHAHNDYEHENPLFDALENGFISVEADVHLMNDQLYVSHFKPQVLDSSKTLENLY